MERLIASPIPIPCGDTRLNTSRKPEAATAQMSQTGLGWTIVIPASTIRDAGPTMRFGISRYPDKGIRTAIIDIFGLPIPAQEGMSAGMLARIRGQVHGKLGPFLERASLVIEFNHAALVSLHGRPNLDVVGEHSLLAFAIAQDHQPGDPGGAWAWHLARRARETIIAHEVTEVDPFGRVEPPLAG